MTRAVDRALSEFLAEAQELVDALGRTVLAIDAAAGAGEPAVELVNDAFRWVHSLKGSSGMVGLGQLGNLAHGLETLLDDLRMDRVVLDGAVVDVLFEAVELFGLALTRAAGGDDLGPEAVAEFLDRAQGRTGLATRAADPGIDDLLARLDVDPSILVVLTEFEEHRLRTALGAGKTVHVATVTLPLTSIDRDLEALRERVAALGEVISFVPGGDTGSIDELAMQVLIATAAPTEALAAAVGEHATLEAVQERAAPPERTAPTSSPPAVSAAPEPVVEPDAQAAGSLRAVSRTVRVDIGRLDGLMTAVGELGLVRSGLSELMERVAAAGLHAEARAMRYQLRGLERRVEELADGILELRMVPLSTIFDKLARVVRKISRGLGKQVALDIGGGETELDKLIVEELSDPLMHIIRNAIDHGIEEPEARRARGKDEQGTVEIRALQQGNRVILTVADDGAGIEEERVVAAAVGRGLVDPAAVAEMDRRERLNLLFLPGMSTREEATELSGRGVGMDVVKTNIAHLRGIIELKSTPGHGTQFTITLPVTLALTQAMVVRVAGRVYAVPLSGVIESVLVEPAHGRVVDGRELLDVRGRPVRLARLDALFRLTRGEDAPVPEKRFAVIVGVAEHRLGLVVDELVSQQDVVVKPLGRALAAVRGIAGATELPGQMTVLVLDVPGLIEEVLEPHAEAP